MKTKALKTIFLATISVLLALPAFAQTGMEDGSKYGKGQDSINCIKNLSLYREFFKHSNYKDAITPWRIVFGTCPASSERMYVEGITMYRSFIEAESDPVKKEQLIDTMLLIYDRRAEYYPKGKGNILGRKGIDLMRYRRADVNEMEKAYRYMKESIEIQKAKSRDAVIVTFVNASVSLNQKGRLEDNQTIEDYFMATEIVDGLLNKSSRWPKAKDNINELMLKSGVLTCEALDGYFEPQFEAKKTDKEFLESVIEFYSSAGCDRANVYVNASEQMYKIAPGPESAHQLAVLFIAKSDFQKAASYLQLAVAGGDIPDNTRAEWFYELAVVSLANKDYCDAIQWAKESIAYNNQMGKAYLTLGDAIIFSRSNLGDDFEQRTAFWVAADKYAKAKSVDPGVTADANKKINDYKGQYPNNEEVFFRDLKDGDSYQVKGCINEYTTVRSRKD